MAIYVALGFAHTLYAHNAGLEAIESRKVSYNLGPECTVHVFTTCTIDTMITRLDRATLK